MSCILLRNLSASAFRIRRPRAVAMMMLDDDDDDDKEERRGRGRHDGITVHSILRRVPVGMLSET